MVDGKENYKFDLGVKGLRQLSDKNNMYQTDSIELSHNCLLLVNPLTPISDSCVTSPYNIHTLFTKQVMRIFKII